jgi:hypothetical protein
LLKRYVQLTVGVLLMAVFSGCTSTKVTNHPPEKSIIRVCPTVGVQFPEVSQLEILAIDGEPDWTYPKFAQDGRTVPPGKRVVELLWTSGYVNLDPSKMFSKSYGQFTVNMEPGKSYLAYAKKEGVRTAETVRMWIVDAASGRTLGELTSKIRQ